MDAGVSGEWRRDFLRGNGRLSTSKVCRGLSGMMRVREMKDASRRPVASLSFEFARIANHAHYNRAHGSSRRAIEWCNDSWQSLAGQSGMGNRRSDAAEIVVRRKALSLV
jgi:hypothetical protein